MQWDACNYNPSCELEKRECEEAAEYKFYNVDTGCYGGCEGDFDYVDIYSFKMKLEILTNVKQYVIA